MNGASDREVLAEIVPLAAVSLAIVLVGQHPWIMDGVVAAAIALRFALSRRAAPRSPLLREVVFFVICTVIGALNDYNTVVVHGVYEYTVPSDLPAISPIPLWMLVTWGLILRFVATLARWHRIGGGGPPSDRVRLFRVRSSAPLRLLVIAVVVVSTRVSTYLNATDPLWSWIPYVLALALVAVLLSPTRRDVWLAALALGVGPVVEALYIRIGGLHRYDLGWFFGVPLWIALWWALGALVWADLSARIDRALRRGMDRRLA